MSEKDLVRREAGREGSVWQWKEHFPSCSFSHCSFRTHGSQAFSKLFHGLAIPMNSQDPCEKYHCCPCHR